MKKIYFLNVLLVLFIALNFAGFKKSNDNKEEIKTNLNIVFTLI